MYEYAEKRARELGLYGALKCFMYHIMYKATYKAH
jgi:hypothetical protein